MLSEVGVISKATGTRLFIGAILAVVAGVAIGVVAVVAALVGGAVSIGGPDVVTVNGGAFAATLAWLAIASLIGAAGALATLEAWTGSLLNTVRLEETWFVVLLVLGAFSFGLGRDRRIRHSGPGRQEAGRGAPKQREAPRSRGLARHVTETLERRSERE
jgi:hypothetical protein